MLEMELSKVGCIIVAKQEEADIMIQPLCGVLATDHDSWMIGTPPLPIPVPYTELTFAILYGKGLNIHLEELAMRMVACGQGSVERFVKAKIAEESKAGRWGRFGYLRKLCSPDYYCPGELEFLANNRILRPLFPIGRIVLFISNAMRAPQNQLRKVLALLKGK